MHPAITLKAAVLVVLVAALPRVSAAATVTLSWTANAETDIAGYRIYYDEASGAPYDGDFISMGPSPFEFLLEDLEDPDNPSVDLLGVPTCMHVYFVATAFNTSGLESDFSNEVERTMTYTPLGLAALPGGVEGELLVTWEELSPADPGAVATYRVHYGFAAGEPYEGTGAIEGDSPVEVLGDASSLYLTGLPPGETVYVMVESVCADETTTQSDEANGTVGEAECGNTVIETGESCDPPSSCPSSCSDDNVCTRDRLVGDPEICAARCRFPAIEDCLDGDGCCPAGCIHDVDDDCSISCGDGVVDAGETCDPPESCPAACNDGDPCTEDDLLGSAEFCNVSCSASPITSCGDGDGCCPTGCTSNNDGDCSASCGDGNVGDGETCDPPGSCPASCNDDNACTSDSMTGSAENCNASCSHSSITTCIHGDGCCPATCTNATDSDCSTTCGNGTIDDGETCDPPGSCPSSCPTDHACTVGTLTGSAANCNAQCSLATTIVCVHGDGCCPVGCSSEMDSDCTGGGVVPPTSSGSESTGCSCATTGADSALPPTAALVALLLAFTFRRSPRRR